MQALVENAPHPRTLTGLTRESISIDGPGGGILSLEPGPPFRYMGRQPLVRPLRVEIENPGKRTWPGLDVQPEGLVQLRYAFSDLQDRLVKTDLAALDADLPPGVSRVSPVIAPPARAGRYRFCADLVQTRGGVPTSLPFDALEFEVEVMGVDPSRPDPMGRLAEAYHEYRKKDLGEQKSRCAKERESSPLPRASR
jgi:hypothetical protein